MSEWNDMFIHALLDQWASKIRIKLGMFFLADSTIIILSKVTHSRLNYVGTCDRDILFLFYLDAVLHVAFHDNFKYNTK